MCQTRRKFIGNIIFLVIVVVFLAIYFARFQIVIVNGDSMAPTYREGQIVLLTKNTSNINLDDIVAFEFNGMRLIKRVVAVNGDSVALNQSGIVINGVKIIGIAYEGDPVDYALSEGQFFVLGDNNLSSLDSREIGLLDSENILGVVIF